MNERHTDSQTKFNNINTNKTNANHTEPPHTVNFAHNLKQNNLQMYKGLGSYVFVIWRAGGGGKV